MSESAGFADLVGQRKGTGRVGTPGALHLKPGQVEEKLPGNSAGLGVLTLLC